MTTPFLIHDDGDDVFFYGCDLITPSTLSPYTLNYKASSSISGVVVIVVVDEC